MGHGSRGKNKSDKSLSGQEVIGLVYCMGCGQVDWKATAAYSTEGMSQEEGVAFIAWLEANKPMAELYAKRPVSAVKAWKAREGDGREIQCKDVS